MRGKLFLASLACLVMGCVAVIAFYTPPPQRVSETCVRGHVYLYVYETGHKPYVVPALDDDGKPVQCGGAL